MLYRCRVHPPLLSKTSASVLHNGFNLIPTPGFSDLNNAISVFKNLSQPNAFGWNAIIKAHIDAGLSSTALSLFSAMRDAFVQPDRFTFPLANRAISSLPARIDLGEAIHSLGIQMGFASDVYFCNTAIDMYVRCDHVSSARHLFDEICGRDVVSWTSIISGYVRIGDIRESFQLFRTMRMEDFEPSSVTLSVILRACGVEQDTLGGRQLHGLAIKRGFESHELVQNSILTLFSKSGCLDVAEKFFGEIEKRSVVSWNIIMAGYLSAGNLFKVVDCYENMKAESVPSRETLTLIISSFAKCGDLLQGQEVHGYAVKSGQIDVVLQSSLVDFYAKCGELASSVQSFEEIKAKNSTNWSVMMSGLIQNGEFGAAVDLFQRMQTAGFEPVADALRGLVLVYTNLGALQLGKGVHGYSTKNGFIDDSSRNKTLETSILNMYVKCGSIVLARKCFDRMVVKDIIAWSSMVEGYAIHGLGSEALKLFYQMQEEGIKPNAVTFLSLLSACSHSGLVGEGREVFDCMTRRFGIKPELTHYTCMVDLLGRSGKLPEALGVIQDMTVEPDGRIWGALLASCRIHTEGKLGFLAARRVFDLEPDNAGYRVVLSNIHAGENQWDEAEDIRRFMGEEDCYRRKKPGWSCIEVKTRVHMFVAGDRSHPQVGEIYEALGCLARQLKRSEADKS